MLPTAVPLMLPDTVITCHENVLGRFAVKLSVGADPLQTEVEFAEVIVGRSLTEMFLVTGVPAQPELLVSLTVIDADANKPKSTVICLNPTPEVALTILAPEAVHV